MISPLIGRENVYVTVNYMGCFHAVLVLLHKFWFHEALEVAVEQGGLMPPARIKTHAFSRQ